MTNQRIQALNFEFKFQRHSLIEITFYSYTQFFSNIYTFFVQKYMRFLARAALRFFHQTRDSWGKNEDGYTWV